MCIRDSPWTPSRSASSPAWSRADGFGSARARRLARRQALRRAGRHARGRVAAFRSVVVPFVAPTGSQSTVKAEIAQSVEHATENRGVASSILALGTIYGWHGLSSGSGSVGRASPCQGEGRGFESRLPLHSLNAADLDGRPPDIESLPLRLVVGQRTLNPFGEVRILGGQPV